MNTMNSEIYLDLRGLEPPEPMERVLDALSRLRQGGYVRMLIDREPRPLYRILDKNGYRYQTRPMPVHEYEVVITQSGNAARAFV